MLNLFPILFKFINIAVKAKIDYDYFRNMLNGKKINVFYGY